jgi:hypothetical protein
MCLNTLTRYHNAIRSVSEAFLELRVRNCAASGAGVPPAPLAEPLRFCLNAPTALQTLGPDDCA